MSSSRLSIIKFLELAITCSCVALHYHSYNHEVDIGMLVTGTFVGFLIVFAGAAAGSFMQTATSRRIDIFYSLVGVGLFVASGALIIDKYQGQSGEEAKKQLAKGSLAVVNGGILLLDAILTQRGG